MTTSSHSTSTTTNMARTAAIAAVVGVTLLAGLLTPARAGSAASPVVQLAQTAPAKTQAGKEVTGDKSETVDQRIANLHDALKITTAQEPLWSAVAQAMRENAAAMEKLVAAKLAKDPQNMTALDDLTTYQDFAQAHVDGLKNLISDFKVLYDSMPADQKKITDEAFRSFGSHS